MGINVRWSGSMHAVKSRHWVVPQRQSANFTKGDSRFLIFCIALSWFSGYFRNQRELKIRNWSAKKKSICFVIECLPIVLLFSSNKTRSHVLSKNTNAIVNLELYNKNKNPLQNENNLKVPSTQIIHMSVLFFIWWHLLTTESYMHVFWCAQRNCCQRRIIH